MGKDFNLIELQNGISYIGLVKDIKRLLDCEINDLIDSICKIREDVSVNNLLSLLRDFYDVREQIKRFKDNDLIRLTQDEDLKLNFKLIGTNK